ncbi:hypothetical protein [Candidatus Solirubrobacter pratensis]|uniref:hypothetical protein n=1 Tax=Candidatus Solirubrobacter pratensis TaxID=1298857 RepID=UPI00041B054A|nr:hypothetical protein [Candidatus Solirubrobacter pratensis]
MRIRSLAAAAAALLLPAAPALAAGDPIMPLAQVQAGMQCTAYSVVRGTDIASFGVEVLDVVDGDPDESGPRILVQVSGPAVDATGVGPGFSGSPIYCADGAGVARNIGAISESIGEYGGKVVLATPIEQIVGTPVDPPAKQAAKDAGHASTARAGWARDLLARAKPLAAPLTISGVSSTVATALQAAAQKAGRTVLAVPAGPVGGYPKQALVPGAAVGTAYSDGDLRYGAVGTVSYVDGDKVWAFGHPLEDAGPRALLLQDAYVFRVINNPVQLPTAATYKLAALGHDLGTLTNDATDAVAGHTGALPHTVPVTALARDTDTGRTATIRSRVADEAAVDLPSGGSWLTSVGPLAVVQAATNVLGSTPGRVTGRMCARIGLAELKAPLRFCNRYVSIAQEQGDDGSLGNAVTTGAAGDLATALSSVDAYTGKPPRITGVSVLLELHRGADQAYLRRISVPRTIRRGTTVKARATLQRLRGSEFTRTYRVRVPGDARPGRMKLRLAGRDADGGDASLGTTIIIGDDSAGDGAGDEGPRTLRELSDQVKANGRYDGVTLRLGAAQERAFRDAGLRISGRAEATVRVTR